MEGPLSTHELIDLMTRAKDGDKLAFEAVYKHCFTPVFRYLLRRVHEASEAEDLAQAVFLKVYTSSTQFTNISTNPLAYLFTVARNTLIDHWRKNKQAPLVSLPEEDGPAEINSLMEQINRESEVQACLATLPSEPRHVLELKFLQGLTTREVALQLGKTEDAVRQIQCRALRQIRDSLKNGEKVITSHD